MASLAKTWLLANPERAAIGLIPTAVGSDGKERDAAERALRYLAGRGHAEVLRGVGKRYGADAARALDEVLDWDPLWDCPSKPPKMPPYWRVAELTRPRLRDGSPLPLPAVEALDEMLAFTQVDPPYAGIADVVAACDPRSLAEHAWDLATTWEQNRAKDSHGWMIDALVHLADEEVVRRTTPALKSPRVVQVLGRIGTDAAAMELATIVSRIQARGQATTYGIGAAAEKQLDEIAAARGLDPEAFEDRITPTLDVDEAGGLTLDYGGRTLRVAFDEKLEPYVTDDDGGRLKNLPPGRKTDDKKKVKAAQEAWKDLREDVRVIADRRIAALERAMSTQRAWTPEAFRAAFVDHPLMLHLTRRIVWAARDAGGTLLGTFRVAEDRSLAGARDDRFELPEDAKITIPHPAAWPDGTLAGWRELLNDYQLLQPFPQLDRPEPGLDAAALASAELVRERPPRAEGAPNNGMRLTQLGWVYKQISGALAYRKTLEDGGAVQASWQPKDEHAGGPLPITLSHIGSNGDKRPLADLSRQILADAYYDLYLRA